MTSVVEKASLVICNAQFSFLHRTSQVEPSPLLLDTFFKSSTLPWKNRQQTASWSFSWSCSPATIDFQKSPSSDFYMARDLSRICRSLRNSWNSISRLFQWVFQTLCLLLAIFLDCNRSPCRSLLISKPTLCKTILSSSFVLESRTKTDKLFFLLWRHSLSNSTEKQWAIYF